MTPRWTRTLALAIAAAAAVACADAGSSTSPVLTRTNASGGTGGGTNGGDTTVSSGGTPGVHGRVWRPSGTSSDTTIYVIVPGASVQILTQPASGGTPALVATVTADATGYYKLDPVADGTYEARATPPVGSGLKPAEAFNILVKAGVMVGYSEVNLVFTATP